MNQQLADIQKTIEKLQADLRRVTKVDEATCKPPTTVRLDDDTEIGKYPVTTAQWRAFVTATGYDAHADSLKGENDWPARYVSYHDAKAYCEWLSNETGDTYDLPTEDEWQKAAGPAKYPWGDDPITREHACYEADHPEPVTAHPKGASPCGAEDMVGNVWEWCK